MRFKYKLTLTFTEKHLSYLIIIAIHLFILRLPDSVFYQSQVAEVMKEKEVKKEKEESREKQIEMLLGKKMRFIGITYLGAVDIIYQSKLHDLMKSKLDKTQEISTTLSGLSRYKKDFTGLDIGSTNTGEMITLSEDEKRSLARRIINTRKNNIKGCYQNHQKLDELLEGHLSISLKTHPANNVVDVKFEGIGQQGIINKLQTCVQKQIESLTFPTQLENRRYKMVFNFN